jgi:hypothetical protein
LGEPETRLLSSALDALPGESKASSALGELKKEE